MSKNLIAAALAAACICAHAAPPLQVGFVYVSPVGQAGWTYQHDLGRREMEKALGGKVTSKYIELDSIVPRLYLMTRMLTSVAASN